MRKFLQGLKDGLPIALGYLSVSFTFGLKAVIGGMPFLASLIISMTNLTSAGQFAGLNLMVAQASYIELMMTTFIINLRYFIMSMSLSQKLEESMPMVKKLILAFGVTDEIFAVNVSREQPVTLSYFMGVLVPSFIGWTSGSTCGAIFSSILPTVFADAMNIALYGMFVAIVLPQAKNDLNKRKAVLLSIAMSFLFAYMPYLNKISSGWTIILITVLVSGFMALKYPIEEVQHETNID